jgi:hypothetical protein
MQACAVLETVDRHSKAVWQFAYDMHTANHNVGVKLRLVIAGDLLYTVA